MKKVLLWALGGVVGFLALCVILPRDHAVQAVELCGDGRALKEAKGASRTDQEYYDLACDHANAQERYDALYRAQHGQ